MIVIEITVTEADTQAIEEACIAKVFSDFLTRLVHEYKNVVNAAVAANIKDPAEIPGVLAQAREILSARAQAAKVRYN